MFLKYLIIYILIVMSESARILFVIPTPSFSHQVVFRPLTQELAKSHKVVVITADPAFKASNRPANLTEIDVREVSYNYFRKHFRTVKLGTKTDSKNIFDMAYKIMIGVLETQLQQSEVKKTLTESFDLIFIESWNRPFLVFSAFWQVPVIKISSHDGVYNDYINIGSSEHMLYPYPTRQKIFNLTLWQKVGELINDYNFYNVLKIYEDYMNDMFNRNLVTNVPPIDKLSDNVQLLYANLAPMWGNNRPVPLSVIYIGGIYQSANKELPKDLQSYLDESINGVIYVSFGTNVIPSLLPAVRMRMIINVLSQLSYDVLFRWDLDVMPGKPENIKIAKWFPQTDVLGHPKVKLFITHGGLQSTEDAIRSSVPLLGLPMYYDQWYNSESYIHYGIGLMLEFESLTEEQLTTAIKTIVEDKSYRTNLMKLRTIINDQPTSPLERAVWWTEHVLRHGGARHLRAPAANMGWAEYYELELLLFVLGSFILLITVAFLISKTLLKLIWQQIMKINPWSQFHVE